MSRDQYLDAVDEIRAEIARGWVYQVNLCRVLSAALPAPVDPIALYQRLSRGNPAPYAGLLSVPGELDVVCASPELMLRRDADQVVSSPIKGTAATADTMLDKDTAENIMIVDLVRNDLARVAVPGGVSVPQLLRVEPPKGKKLSDFSQRQNEVDQWTTQIPHGKHTLRVGESLSMKVNYPSQGGMMPMALDMELVFTLAKIDGQLATFDIAPKIHFEGDNPMFKEMKTTGGGALVFDTVGLTPGGVTGGGRRTPETHLSEGYTLSADGKRLTIHLSPALVGRHHDPIRPDS